MAVFCQEALGTGQAQHVHVGAGRLLACVRGQRLREEDRVRRIEHHEVLHQFRVLRRQAPGHRTTPVVGDHGEHRRAQRLDHGAQVGHQQMGFVSADIHRLRGQVETPQIDRDTAEIG